jgi:hypothetical protein
MTGLLHLELRSVSVWMAGGKKGKIGLRDAQELCASQGRTGRVGLCDHFAHGSSGLQILACPAIDSAFFFLFHGSG